MSAPGAVAFDHLSSMCDQRGLHHHAAGGSRDMAHGYRTDDHSRLLAVTALEHHAGTADQLQCLALEFVLDAQAADGRFHDRMDSSGRWTDLPTAGDCWGRALLGLGVTSTLHDDAATRRKAIRSFTLGARLRSHRARPMAFAAIGAVSVLTEDPGHRVARALLHQAVDVIGPIPSGSWSWPEAELTYANAALAEAVIAAGDALDLTAVLDQGLTMLAWLLALETEHGHLSVTGVTGRGPDDHGQQFEQRPMEVAAMADACWRAFTVTGDNTWSRGVAAAAGWFVGDNDTGLAMHDDVSGGGFDRLYADRVDVNQGAEATLALVSTMQRAHSFAPAR